MLISDEPVLACKEEAPSHGLPRVTHAVTTRSEYQVALLIRRCDLSLDTARIVWSVNVTAYRRRNCESARYTVVKRRQGRPFADVHRGLVDYVVRIQTFQEG